VEDWTSIIGNPDPNYIKKERENMKYLVKFNEKYKGGYFDDTTVLDEKGKMVKRDKNSEPWIVDETRKEFLLQHGAIEVLEEVTTEKTKPVKKVTKKK
jgi:hypothetical protein